MINKLIDCARRTRSNIKRYSKQSSCYTKREREGTATMGCCSGLWGGDYYTNYLQYSCVGCKHYTDVGHLRK